MDRRVILERGRAEIFLGENRMAALRAKIRSGGKLGCAISALSRQPRSTLLAELCRDRVLVLTCRAFHPKPCEKWAERRLAQAKGVHPQPQGICCCAQRLTVAGN